MTLGAPPYAVATLGSLLYESGAVEHLAVVASIVELMPIASQRD